MSMRERVKLAKLLGWTEIDDPKKRNGVVNVKGYPPNRQKGMRRKIIPDPELYAEEDLMARDWAYKAQQSGVLTVPQYRDFCGRLPHLTNYLPGDIAKTLLEVVG